MVTLYVIATEWSNFPDSACSTAVLRATAQMRLMTTSTGTMSGCMFGSAWMVLRTPWPNEAIATEITKSFLWYIFTPLPKGSWIWAALRASLAEAQIQNSEG